MKSTYSATKTPPPSSPTATATTDTPNGASTQQPAQPEAGKFRTIFAQILAISAQNLLMVDIGMAIAFPTIVIPVLRGLHVRNPDETLYFSAVQATWFGSVSYISLPIGSVLSGWVSEPIGRRKAMMLLNIPHIIAWTMMYYAQSMEMLFAAAVLLGLGVGLMEAPNSSYVAEITQPSIRGIVIASTSVSVILGVFGMYLLGTLMVWRNVALVCLSVPLASVVAIYYIPETPIWLLSKKRDAEAQRSLQWLRGWVSAAAVEREFAEITRYSENSNSCIACQKAGKPCSHPPADLREKVRELLRKRTLRPFAMMIACFTIAQFSGMMSIRPFMVQILDAYAVPVDANWATVVMGLVSLLANIVCMSVVKVIGKRKLYFVSLVGAALSCFALSFYAHKTMPSGWSTFDIHTRAERLHVGDGLENGHFAMTMFFSLSFFTSVGLSTIPWILISEVFPFKSRGIATGLTAALNYVMTFVSVKTYLNVETWLTIPGSMIFYGMMNAIGLIFIYVYLPETEGRTLEEIELFFSDNMRPMSERKIKPSGLASSQNKKLVAISNNGFDNRAYVEQQA